MKFCKECGMSAWYHVNVWFDEITKRCVPSFPLPLRIERFFNMCIERFFLFFGIISIKKDFSLSDIQLRTACVIREAQKRGVDFSVLCGPRGYMNHYLAHTHGRTFRFEGLPIADFVSAYGVSHVDDKDKTKQKLCEKEFPVAEGKSFWFWQKKKALEYGIQMIGFPLVVKPQGGSISRHVTTNICTKDALESAIRASCEYSPIFLIEKFVARAGLYRATVVDMNYVACVQQVPAHVRGNGSLTIQELIEEKNISQKRGDPSQKDITLYYLVINDTSNTTLAQQGYTLKTILKYGEIAYLHKDPFLKLGADLFDATDTLHVENKKLFLDIARIFDIRLVGIDMLIPDISRSWKEQECAILELNNLPCIEMHHFPSGGASQNIAKEVVDLFFKYYV
jgi:cyanophycin synthetase